VRVALLRGGGGSGEVLRELHCHEMGLGASSGPEAALVTKAEETEGGISRRAGPSASPAVLDEQSQMALTRGFEGAPGFSRDHVPKSSLFLSTSRLLL
jgi:hypothetical protein